MHDRKKERAIALLGIATALMLLVGCEGQEIQKRTEQEEADIASQVQQNVEEKALSDEASPEQSEKSEESERSEQTEESEQMPEEISGDKVQDKLDEERINPVSVSVYRRRS